MMKCPLCNEPLETEEEIRHNCCNSCYREEIDENENEEIEYEETKRMYEDAGKDYDRERMRSIEKVKRERHLYWWYRR